MHPEAFDGNWVVVLDQADRALQARLEEHSDVGEGEPLPSIASMLGIAHMNAAEGNLYQATVSLATCEGIAASL